MAQSLLQYIDLLENNSFDGWSEESEKGYLTALTSIKMKIKENAMKKVIPYNEMDLEVIKLCKAINALPSLTTLESCGGHGQEPFKIWFYIDDYLTNAQGLFFLTRCCDRRYWQYGHEWSISLSVGDTYGKDEIYPVHFKLESKAKGEDAYAQADDLYDNMIHHLNHKNFKKLFEIDLQEFNVIVKNEELSFNV